MINTNKLLKKGLKILIVAGIFYFVCLMILYFIQDKLVFYPQKLTAQAFSRVSAANEDVEEIKIKVEDDKYLNGWLYKGDKSEKQKLIIYFGGNADEVSDMLNKFKDIKNWSVSLINYRGYGTSDGKPSEEDIFADALKIYDYYKSRADIDSSNIVIMGRSLGTGVATYLASQRESEGVILISPYESVESVAREKTLIVPVDLLLKHKFKSIDYATKINAPLLCVYATRDFTVPAWHSKALLQEWNGAKQVIEIEGEDHNSLLNRIELWNGIKNFLKELK